MAFSHVHQLCAPRDFPEQATCQWSGQANPEAAASSSPSSSSMANSTFSDAVREMDWIAGQILQALDAVSDNTLVLFTSDNGPWVAEQSCSGSKGPFQGDWLRQNVATSCTACPHDYVADPTSERPRRCVLPGTAFELDGVHCGEDTGLGGVWEANLRMPALARFPGKIKAGSQSHAMVSSPGYCRH